MIVIPVSNQLNSGNTPLQYVRVARAPISVLNSKTNEVVLNFVKLT
jgi:hypothetical protein